MNVYNRPLRIYGYSNNFFLKIIKPNGKTQTINFNTKNELIKFMNKYKKKVIIKKQKINKPKEKINKIVRTLLNQSKKERVRRVGTRRGYKQAPPQIVYIKEPNKTPQQEELIKNEKEIEKLKLMIEEAPKKDDKALQLMLQKNIWYIMYNDVIQKPEILKAIEQGQINKDDIKQTINEEIKKDDYNETKIEEKIKSQINKGRPKLNLSWEEWKIRQQQQKNIKKALTEINEQNYEKKLIQIKKFVEKMPTDENEKKEDLMKKYIDEYKKKASELNIILPQQEKEEEEPIKELTESDIEGMGIKVSEWDDEGLWNIEIIEIMEPFKSYGFLGCIWFDELKKMMEYIIKKD